MALTAVRPAMNHDEQNLHPFFSKAQRDAAQPSIAGAELAEASVEAAEDASATEKPRRKRSKKGSAPGKGQTSLNFLGRQQAQSDCDTPNSPARQLNVEEDPNYDRRKRQKTGSPIALDAVENLSANADNALEWQAQLEAQVEQVAAGESSIMQTGKGEDAVDLSTSSETADASVPAEAGTITDGSTPRKQIKITKSGKLLSSPPKSTLQEPTTPKKRRGRKPAKAKILPTVTIIRYGSNPATRLSVGQKIEAILNGPQAPPKAQKAPKRDLPKPAQPPKSTHPFFTGKTGTKSEKPASERASDQHPPTPRKSAVTPGKLRAEARRDRSPGRTPGFEISLGRNKASNQAGLFEPSWPTRETCHVRNIDAGQAIDLSSARHTSLTLRPRKAKHRVITLRDDEEIISRLTKDISQERSHRPSRTSSEFAPPQNVRLPSRLLTTGFNIQERVRQQLSTQHTGHPAIRELFTDIEHTLTPFDEGRCENQAWVHKYSPKSASNVLHPGKEAFILKDWLQNLTVMAVGGAQQSKPDTTDPRGPPKKKRKKAFDDFIVSDDEDADEDMIECPESDVAAQYGPRSYRIPTWTRNKNVILISGPQGCGKSATVYAVAKELDFEVFEIHSGTRRSGKDIQDKVGDMTANHLVNHKRPDAPSKEPATDIDTDNERLSLAVQNDIESGRQGTVMNFFKASPAAGKPTAKPKKKIEIKGAVKASAQATLPTSQARKSQKQSLILFEEADILYEEDQQFWAQVAKLAAQSKRPIVITCNNERQIPMHILPLAAILRFQPAPSDLATDYMLVIAGREGHILERGAVTDLYKSKGFDLRASITELNFWCQMSVGDRKGGLEWMYQRWPPGRDTDAEGRPLRVASENTYQPGMGFLSHDVFEAQENTAFRKGEELLGSVWKDWGIGPDRFMSTSNSTSSSDSTMQMMSSVEAYTDALSSADVYCRVGLPTYENDFCQAIDASQPSITAKARLNYTLDAPLLQVDQQSDFHGFDTAMYMQTLLQARRVCVNPPDLVGSRQALQPTTELEYTNTILETKGEKNATHMLSRYNFSSAFDILADPPDAILPERTSFNLTSSSFDRTFRIITEDLAPYVRSIVAHEQVLEEQRLRLSNLLCEGGKGKRARTTRASRVALEGGVRETKRRDQWFDTDLSFPLVMATAGKEWAGMGWKGEEHAGDDETGTGSAVGTQDSVEGSADVVMHGISNVRVDCPDMYYSPF